MDINLITKLFFLLVPGSIALIIYRRLVAIKHFTSFYFIIYSFVLGTISYAIYTAPFILYFTLKELPIPEQYDLIKVINLKEYQADTYQIAFTTIIAIFVSFVLSKMSKTGIINKIGMLLKVTNRMPGDIWDEFQNGLAEDNGRYVNVHGFKDKIYMGWISNASNDEKKKELILNDVSVFDEKSKKKIYNIPKCYISLRNFSISIEVLDENKGEANNET